METSRLPKFSENFAKLRGEMSQAQFAEKLGISRATVGLYENGSRLPDALVLKNIAEKCGVSVDYLVGLVPEPTNKIDMRAMCEYTGLSEEVLAKIHQIYIVGALKNILGDFLKNYAAELFDRLSSIEEASKSAQCVLDTISAKYVDEYSLLNTASLPLLEDILSSDKELAAFALEKIENMRLDDGIVAQAEKNKSQLELSLYRLSKATERFPELYNANAILDELEAVLRVQQYIRAIMEIANAWTDARDIITISHSSDPHLEYTEIRLKPGEYTAPLSARNIPSTAGEAQSGTPGGDSSPIEERQDGKHKEDKW